MKFIEVFGCNETKCVEYFLELHAQAFRTACIKTDMALSPS